MRCQIHNNGNRNTGGSTVSTGNRLSNDGTYSYTYENDGNVLTKTDGSGNHWDYTYDVHNELTDAKYTNSLASVVEDETYAYGPFGERLQMKYTDYGNSANNFTRDYASADNR